MQANQSNTRFSIQSLIHQLLILVLIGTFAACGGCGNKDQKKAPSLGLNVNQVINGDDYILQVDIVNQEDQTIKLNDVKLVATVTHETGGTETTLFYEFTNGMQTNSSMIDRLVSDFLGNEELEGKDTETILLKVLPGQAVTAVKLHLAVVNIADQQTIVDQETTFGFSTVFGESIRLGSKTDAIGKRAGQFFVQAIKDAVNPSDIEVTLSNKDATFQFTKTKTATAKLSDLLGRTSFLPVGSDLGPIEFKLAADTNESVADIAVNFKQGNRLLGTGSLSWSKKDFHLRLQELSYDASTRQIRYEVVKSGKAPIDDKDNIKLQVCNTSGNKSTCQKAPILIKDKDALKGLVPITFKKEKNATFEVKLWYGSTLISTQAIKVSKVEQLEFAEITKDKSGDIQYVVTNKGKKLQGVSIKYACISGSATIGGETKGQLAQSFALGGKKPTLIGSIGKLTLNGPAATFKFTLLYDAAEVVTRVESFYQDDFDLQLAEPVYNQEKQTIRYEITNSSTADITTVKNLALFYQNHNPNSQATLNNGKQGSILITDKAQLEGYLSVNLGSEQTASFDLILKLGEVQIGAVQTVSCIQENVNLVFDHPNPINLGGDLHAGVTTNIRIKNTGKDEARKKVIKVFAQKTKGANALINVKEAKIGELIALAVPQGIAAGKSLEVVKLRIDPNGDAEVDLILTLQYDDQTPKLTMQVGWKTTTQGILTFPDGGDLVGDDAKQATLQFRNTAGRTLELSKLRLNYTVQGNGQLCVDGKGDIQGQTLETLTGQASIKENGSVDIPVKLTSDQESKFNITLTDGGTTLGTSLNWRPFPTVTLSLDDGTTVITGKEAKLKVSGLKKLTPEQISKIRIAYKIEENKDGVIAMPNKDLQRIINGKLLSEAEIKNNVDDATIELTFKKFAKGDTKITFELSGSVKGASLVVTKRTN